MTNLTELHENLAAQSKWGFSESAVHQLHPEALTRGVEHEGPGRHRDRDHGAKRRRGRGCTRGRSSDRHRCVPRHHCAMNILYSLQHLGYVIAPQAAWLGEAGLGPSYLDPGSGGPENDFTNRNTTFLAWNLMHLARMLKDAGGIPAHGNQRSAWDAGCRFDYVNPDYR